MLDMLLTQWNDLCNAEDEEFQKVSSYLVPMMMMMMMMIIIS